MEPTVESPPEQPATPPTNGGPEPTRALAPLPATDDLAPLWETAGLQARDMLGGLLLRLGNPPNPRILHLMETFAGYYREMAAALATSGDSLFRPRRKMSPYGYGMMMPPSGPIDSDDDGGTPTSETFGAQVLTNMMGTVQDTQSAQAVAGYTKALKDAKAAGLPEEVIAVIRGKLGEALGVPVPPGPAGPGPTAPVVAAAPGWFDEEGAA